MYNQAVQPHRWKLSAELPVKETCKVFRSSVNNSSFLFPLLLVVLSARHYGKQNSWEDIKKAGQSSGVCTPRCSCNEARVSFLEERDLIYSMVLDWNLLISNIPRAGSSWCRSCSPSLFPNVILGVVLRLAYARRRAGWERIWSVLLKSLRGQGFFDVNIELVPS